MKTFEFACGGARPELSPPDGEPVRLDVQGDARNVNLKITDINRAMVSNIPEVLLDLLEVAAYVYCADQRASRGSDKLTEYGRHWRRAMNFTIPVRRPELWASDAVTEALCETLGFLSDDSYSFSFVEAGNPLAERERYFEDLAEGTFVPDEVVLFSGGVDSFAGAIEDLVGHGKRLALVGHHSAPQVYNVQKDLIDRLKQCGLGPRLFYIPVNVTNAGFVARETTQRTRSFLFACLALVVARMFGKDEFTFYENGVVSLNLPVARDVLGARATRTTHPRVIRGFEEVFSAVLEQDIRIKTPFRWLTKTEVTRKISDHGFGHLLTKTNSCTKPRTWTKRKRHCGACSQCIDRRFAVLAADLEALDPAEQYQIDLLLGDRSGERDLRMAVDYVKFFQTFATSARSRLISGYPQVASALSNVPGMSADEAKDRIYDLYHRHAEDVLAVIGKALEAHRDALVRGELPAGSLLSMCMSRSRLETPTPSGYDGQIKRFMDGLAKPVCEFAVDVGAGKILFKGGFCLEGTNFRLVHALLDEFRAAKRRASEIGLVRPSDLAATLGIDEPSLRKQIERLRKHVAERLPVDQGIVLGTDGFVENQQGQGYRLSPALREGSLGDLLGVIEPMSQA